MYRPSISSISQLAPLGVSVLICILSYASQIFFCYMEPYYLDRRQTIIFNTLVACIWLCYSRACLTNPGYIPPDWNLQAASGEHDTILQRQRRWCRKCNASKPPRAHHCKTCKRCIPKMDHHCPWTVNCVSHRTFPHFMRFLLYAVMAMAYLQYFLYLRAVVVWNGRNLPSYLGPSSAQLASLFVLLLINSFTLFALMIIFLRSVWSLCTNVTAIESWEIERHQTLVRRARALGGYLDGPDGVRVRIVKQEFPYDVGIWSNIKQGMGSGLLTWLWPFAATPPYTSGLDFEVNGFEDPSVSWPPPDPDRMIKTTRSFQSRDAFTFQNESMSNMDQIKAFRQRQEQDIGRLQPEVSKRRPFHKRFEDPNHRPEPTHALPNDNEASDGGEEAWKNSEGERLDDFGVDEEVEFYDEDNIPLAQLLQKRKPKI